VTFLYSLRLKIGDRRWEMGDGNAAELDALLPAVLDKAFKRTG